MTTQDGPSRIAELRALLHQANDAYYQQADPIMPDRTYDELMAELADLEAAHPALDDSHSPTRRVGGGLIEGFETVEHLVPMQSIDNAYDTEAIVVWLERITAQLDGEQPAVFADPKIDGVAMSIHYRDGQLELAVTRGDGVRGDDITAQARRMLSVPLRLAEAVTVEVRGEAVIPNDAFAEVNAQRAAADEPLFKNARNTTAGTLKSLNTDLVAQRQVQFIMHSRGAGDDLGAATWGEFCSAAATLGLPVSDLGRRFTSTDDLLAHLEAFAATRHTLDVGIDGMVVRVDRFDLQHELGATAKAPRWCIALKYPAEQVQSTLLAVNWQVGRNGTLTPRATLDPVDIAGTTVQHATLHNIEEIRRKDIRLGDAVLVEKAGEIIPQVLGPVLDTRTDAVQEIEPPARCPVCDGAVEQEGPKLFCVNAACPAQLRERLAHFAGRGQMDIDGLGDRLVDELVEIGLVQGHGDIYALTVDDLVRLEGMAATGATKLVEAIEASKSRGLAKVLAAVGIRHVGRTVATTLARAVPDFSALAAMTPEALAELDEVGDVIAASVHDTIHSLGGSAMFAALQQAGLDLTGEAGHGDADSFFAGKRIVLTGTLEHFDRRSLTERLEGLGAKVSSSVSAKTDLLIAGANAGAKLAKAEALGIDIWDEATVQAHLD